MLCHECTQHPTSMQAVNQLKEIDLKTWPFVQGHEAKKPDGLFARSFGATGPTRPWRSGSSHVGSGQVLRRPFAFFRALTRRSKTGVRATLCISCGHRWCDGPLSTLPSLFLPLWRHEVLYGKQATVNQRLEGHGTSVQEPEVCATANRGQRWTKVASSQCTVASTKIHGQRRPLESNQTTRENL